MAGSPAVSRNRPTRTERAERTADLLAEAARADVTPQRLREIHDEVITINREVAEAVANRYAHRGLQWEDLRQVAYEGLVKATQRFDPTQSNNFLTYAVPTIRGEVQRHFRDFGWALRPPRRIQELQRQVTQVSQELAVTLGREPTRDELSAALDLSPAQLDEVDMARGCFNLTSLDQPLLSGTGTSIADAVSADDADADAAASEARLTLAPAVRSLSERNRRILYLRFFEDRNQREIGEELGITQMQVSRLLQQMFDRLRLELA